MGLIRFERVVWRKKLSRAEWLKSLLDKIELDCEIGMEACGGAHHWARLLQQRGFTVKLIAPQFVQRRNVCKRGGVHIQTYEDTYWPS